MNFWLETGEPATAAESERLYTNLFNAVHKLKKLWN